MTRPIELSVEVPGPPEEVWEAIATGPGISVWYVPTELEERLGGRITMNHGDELEESGEVTAWEPTRRFAFETDALDGRVALELLVEARRGGTCVVRLVSSGFGDGADWEKMRDSNETGWRMCLRVLRLYLTHFRGQPSAHIQTFGTAAPPEDSAWAALRDALGVGDAREGDRIAVDQPPFAGVVDYAGDREWTLRLDEPAPGVGVVAVGGPADVVYTQVSASLFGDDAEAVAERERSAWQAWMRDRFPMEAG
jgi:uncharacterized protein YndB with AHSA1/START domain